MAEKVKALAARSAELAALTLSNQKISSELDSSNKKLKDQMEEMNKVSKLLDETKVELTSLKV